MTNEQNSAEKPEIATVPHVNATSSSSKPRCGLGWKTAIVGVALLMVGAGAGAFAMKGRHDERMALLPPVAISAMTEGDLVAIKGKVTEQFGNKFILTDGTARALIETGRAGEDTALVKDGEEVTVQGRYHSGFLHAGMIIHADGKVDELKPPPPPHGPSKKFGHRGPEKRPDAEHPFAPDPAADDAPRPPIE